MVFILSVVVANAGYAATLLPVNAEKFIMRASYKRSQPEEIDSLCASA